MSALSDSNNQEDASDSDDPLVEIPLISGTGTELVKKSQITPMDIRGMVVKCTICSHQINLHEANKFMKHYRLSVIVCKDCYEFYGTSEFSQDESGNYNYCTWCGNGGKLYLCDFCPNSFCSTCVRKNFGRREVTEMSKEGWKCYICKPQKLKSKVEFCQMLLDYSNNVKNKKEKKANAETQKIKILEPLPWTESKDWILPAFDELDDSCTLFHKKLDKLKAIGSAETKSVKHVIEKIEGVIAAHKSELGQIIKSLSVRYTKYLSKKKAEEKLKNQTSNREGLKTDKSNKEVFEVDSTSDSEIALPTKGVMTDKDHKAKMALLADESSDSSSSEVQNFEVGRENKKYGPAEMNGKISKQDAKVLEKENVGNCDEEEQMVVDMDPHSLDLFENNASGDEKVSEPEEEKVNDSKTMNFESFSSLINSSKFPQAKSSNSVRRKLSFLNAVESDSSSSISILNSDNDDVQKKETVEKTSVMKDKTKIKKSRERINKEIDISIDPKLNSDCCVILKKCDYLLPNGETTITLPDDYLLEDIDKEIETLFRPLPKTVSRRSNEVDSDMKSKPSGNKKKILGKKKTNKLSSSSSSICLTSSDDEKKQSDIDRFPSSKKKNDIHTVAQQKLLMSDSDSESSYNSEPEEVKKKKRLKKENGNAKKSDSSDDFQPRKKKKFDKLLNKQILSDDDSSKDSNKEKKQPEKKKSTKRKLITSEDDTSKDKKNSDSFQTSSESEDEKEKKKPKRRRIKKIASSSSDNEDKEKKASQGTPGKGRKNINKILNKKNLTVETKEAQNAERERRKRVIERQKLYNIITDTSTDGTSTITRKMVLEVDPVSKEEIVEIDPELCEKLKPHQVKGVRFMWECTIESLKELEKSPGSGCILAHCMGLGKTLQVITFLHTCLTNEHVSKKIRTALVICPYNTVLNWAREFEYWLEKVDGDVLVHQLTDGKDNFTRLDILKYWHRDGGVLIASYDIFRRLAAEKRLPRLNKKNRDKLYEILVDPGPDIVVCDEGHILKNERSAISKACSKLSTERRIVLTGTPLQNNLNEYHCMLSFVKPHLLGTSKEFRNRFVNPIMNGQYDDSNEYDVKRMKKRIHILHKLLEGCVQRCDYSALTKFLPPKHEFVISVKCSDIQIKMYQYYLDNLSQHKADSKIRGSTLFSDYNILRNLCTHPYIVHTSYERTEINRLKNEDPSDDEFINDESEESSKDSNSGSESAEEVVKQYKTRSRQNEDGSEEESEEEPREKRWYNEFITDEDRHKVELSGKMVLLIEILKECEAIGDKVIVFSQSLLTLDIIEDILSYIDEQEISEEEKQRDIYCRWTKGVDYFRMDGTTSADLRKRYIDLFNSPKNDRARLFLVSTKAGGLGTNLVGANRVVMLDASWNPSHDVQAIFRVYRFGQHKPVYIYRLLAQGTMEEKIYDRQVTKLSLSIRVVDEQQIDRHFNAAELAELYKFEPDSLSNRPTPMVPNDTLLAEMLIKHNNWIVTYHEHDSLLQNQTEEDLTEEERQAAWNEYENEREGRVTMNNDLYMGADIAEYSREPDFNEADYAGNMIPTCKNIIEQIIANLKLKFPTAQTSELRRRLVTSLHTLRNNFQEKHVRFLRLKQEYVAKGSVPVSINKYLDELNTTLKELAKHIENIEKMVQADYAAQMQHQLQQQQARYAQQQASAQYAAGGRMPFAGTGGRMPQGGYIPFVNMQQNLQARMAQFPNINQQGASNFRSAPRDQRWNPAAGNSVPRQTPAQTSEPVITEVEDDGGSSPEQQQYPSNKPPSMVIEEIVD